ncbi:transposase family protein [Streptomyces virginiae]|uniref:transposase family protein n=1 Tax=Streptomyces virginiae TaxID=1961 RepID=UPI0036C208CA
MTAPDGTLVGISPALPGRTHDLTAARQHRIITTCIRLGIPALADRGCQGAGDIVAVPRRRRPNKGLTVRQRSVNPANSRLRWPIEKPSRRSRHGRSSAKPAATQAG